MYAAAFVVVWWSGSSVPTFLMLSGELHTPAALHPSMHWIGGWVVPRASVDVVERGKYVSTLQNHTLCLCLAHRLVALPTVYYCNTKQLIQRKLILTLSDVGLNRNFAFSPKCLNECSH
jgi:hypothetical protein